MISYQLKISYSVFTDHFVLDTFIQSFLTQVIGTAPISLGCDEFAMGLRIDSPNRRETVAKRSHGTLYRKVFACIANSTRTGRQSFKHVILFVRQKLSQNRRQIIAYVANPSRTSRQPFADVRKHIARKFPRCAQCNIRGWSVKY